MTSPKEPEDPIVVVPYDDDWPAAFAEEHSRIASVAPVEGALIEHIGSTSVPGLAAKPVIDILIGLPTLLMAEPWILALQRLDYEYVPQFETIMPERRYFRRIVDGIRRQQIHMVEWEQPFWIRHVAFREYLRAFPAVAAHYGRLKLDLAAQHRDDREAYMDGKDAFIKATEADALTWWQQRR
jgi:GrpB-like predicted nucleotidyltransferase (UPF0157 family)